VSRDLLRSYYDRLDGRPLDRAHDWVDDLAGFFAEDATIRAGNGAPQPWRSVFVQEGAKLPEVVASTTHEIVNVVDDGDGRVACELEVTYAMRRGGTVTLHGSVFAVVRDGRFAEQHLYVDFGPVFRAARKGA
jgi:ketosteroid isomerase-like protein